MITKEKEVHDAYAGGWVTGEGDTAMALGNCIR